jgi:hypothetical protein
MEELGRRLGELPDQFRQTLEPLYERALESFRLRSRIMNVAKDALERMRLEMTCIQFDLEVTRREKEALEKQLEGE